MKVNVLGSGGHAKTISFLLGDTFNRFYDKDDGEPDINLPLVIGIGAQAVRKRLYNKYAELGYTMASPRHHGVYVGPGCSIGINVILNTGCIVEHDCFIGDHVHIAPGAVVLGGATVRDDAMVGANATIIQGAVVFKGDLIKAGTVYG